jgi:prepilin-type N-terminal cleavage/methylation domain-containing protein
MGRTGKAGGFSLVELMIVIAIFGIVSSMAAFTWQKIVANNNLRTAARDLAADIALYRQKAVGEGTAYVVTFNMGGNIYTITPGNIVKSPAIFGSGCALAATTFAGNVINILSRGLLNNGTVTMTNARGSSATVTVDVAGRVRVAFAMQ